MNYWDPLEDDDKEWFESIPNPNLCYERLQRVVGLEEKADDHSNDMLKAIQWLKGNSGQGYQIYADVGDLFDHHKDNEEDDL